LPVLALLSAGCRDPVPPQADGTVIQMIMDGARLEETLGDDPSSATGEQPAELMPAVWDELLPQGVRSTQAWNLAASVTVPAHAMLVTGRRVPVANYSIGEEPGQYRPSIPTLGEMLRLQDPSTTRGQSATVANTMLLKTVGHSIWPGFGWTHSASFHYVGEQGSDIEPAHDDLQVFDTLRDLLSASPVRQVLVNLHQVDRSGHFGDDDDYLQRVHDADQPLADLWSWLQQHHDYAGDTWLLLASDHGRHSAAASEPPWRHHGDACTGCRRVPFLLLGPDVQRGVDAEAPLLLVDVAPTLGALLRVQLPWADGLVRDDLLTLPTGYPSRSGLADLAIAGSHRAELLYLDDPAHRTELELDGQLVSEPDAIAVEAPVLAVRAPRAWLCWREVLLDPEATELSWVPRCLATADQGLEWSEIGFPVDRVGPYWRPALAPTQDGDLLVAWAHNPNGLATESWATEESDVSIDAALHDGESWTRASSTGVHSFPIDAAIALAGEGANVAVGAGRNGDEARHSRDIHLGRVLLDEDGGLAWQGMTMAGLSALVNGDPHWRMELPALRRDDEGQLWLAAIGLVDMAGHAVVASSGDGGNRWDQAGLLPVPYRPMPHIPPVWLADRAVFATVDPDSQAAWLCAGRLDEEPACIDAGTSRILRLLVEGDQVHALVDAGVGEWEDRSWSSADFDPGASR